MTYNELVALNESQSALWLVLICIMYISMYLHIYIHIHTYNQQCVYDGGHLGSCINVHEYVIFSIYMWIYVYKLALTMSNASTEAGSSPFNTPGERECECV